MMASVMAGPGRAYPNKSMRLSVAGGIVQPRNHSVGKQVGSANAVTELTPQFDHSVGAGQMTKLLHSKWIFISLERFFHGVSAIALFAIWDASP